MIFVLIFTFQGVNTLFTAKTKYMHLIFKVEFCITQLVNFVQPISLTF